MPDKDNRLRELADRVAMLEARVDYLDGVRAPAPRRAKPMPWATPQGDYGIDATTPNPDDLAPRAPAPSGPWFDPATGLMRNANGEITDHEVANRRAGAIIDEMTRGGK
jgi:hypothetical protein